MNELIETTFGSVSPMVAAPPAYGTEGLGVVCVAASRPGRWRVRRMTVGNGHDLRLIGIHSLTLPGVATLPLVDHVLEVLQKAGDDVAAIAGLGPNVLGGEIPCAGAFSWTLDAAGLLIGGDRILIALFRNMMSCPVYLPAIGALCARVEP